mmetsp:Transcript_63589/g.103028  ORF Transcript_63589/g.103028 Transcript_63589/m.103028 type:complete len:712 (+) Transcript_63589:187-2322(+)|eukprot:CAMPEP_0115121294 /NCGR_PEP_ID=MMETSP0227-20121206/46168_1 /TAXON_ID=89957 /ORGANISM="Polarella glacialis, Strain CCMP 1383" /LENGTH=711 /DNA_ID=CAMNT_0002523061 /DNA_START=127 /DNA_END=2262 /DNA_ORIENTATION=+
MPSVTAAMAGLRVVLEDEFPGLSPMTRGGSGDLHSPCGSAVGSAGGASGTGSSIMMGSQSQLSESKNSARTAGMYSAFTAPPRYRNSGTFVHGTKFRHFKSIMEKGLKAAKSEIFMIDEVRRDGRVPGLKDPPEMLIFIDENKARSQRMDFEYDAQQGTWKTKGIAGVIRPWFFQKIVDQRRGPGKGNVLFQSREDPLMQANLMKGTQKPQYLIHATFWENVVGIMKEGILPAKNPTSDTRGPFRELLQGAESHVYTVRPALKMEAWVTEDRPPVGIHGMLSAEPEALPEDSEAVSYMIEKETVGLDRRPDAFIVIDIQRAEELGLDLDMVLSAERAETVFVQGRIPTELFLKVEHNCPINLPDSLKANIVDPRSFQDIPIIDLQQDEATLVEQLRYACEDVGFMQITGHGVSEELQARHRDFHKRFFQLPDEVKERLKLNEDSPVRGWFGRGGEDLDNVLQDKVDKAGGQKVAQQSRKDCKEALDTNGVPWSKPNGHYVASIFGKPSRLPEEEELAGFKGVLEEYAAEMFKVAKRLLSLMAIVLGKDRDFFEQYLTNPVATLRMLHYWPLKDFQTEIGVGEHTDYGLLTILKQDEVGGLQVLNARDSKWVHACPVANAFVVNIGDMLCRWTAHRFKSTVHRVVNTSVKERYSVPYFLEPNMDTVIRYGGLCSGPGMAAMEATTANLTAEDILERFYRASGQLKTPSKEVP